MGSCCGYSSVLRGTQDEGIRNTTGVKAGGLFQGQAVQLSTVLEIARCFTATKYVS